MRWRFLLIGICFLLCFPPIVGAKENPSLYLQASSLEADIGQPITITVFGNDLVDMYGYEFNMSFDSKMFNVKSVVSPISGFSIPAIIKSDLITFAHTKVGRAAVGENGTVKLAIITLESRLAGKASFSLQNVKLVNSQLAETDITGNSQLNVQILSPISFHDIENHWAKKDILRAVSLGMVNGFPDGTFLPQKQVTRAEFATMLARALHLNSAAVLSFADQQNIPEWAQPSISAAVTAGIAKGYPDHTFRPDSLISRVEMAVMSVRGAGADAITDLVPQFDDNVDIPEWAQAAVAAAAKLNLIQGRGNNRFAPQQYATRAEALKIVLNLYDSLNLATASSKG